MEKIDDITYNQLEDPRWGRKSWFTDKLLELSEGEMLFISKEEWEEAGYKTTPYKLLHCYQYMKQSRLLGRTDLKAEHKKEGWVILRI
jgi:hypothetical protein